MAKNKKENYTPQFDFDITEEIDLEVQTCNKCGKTGKHLGLNSDGICLDCQRKLKIQRSEESHHEPNKELYLKYLESKKITKILKIVWFGIAWKRLHKYGCLMFFAIDLIALGALIFLSLQDAITTIIALILIAIGISLTIIAKKRVDWKFIEYNSRTVTANDKHWKCPCCKTLNLGDSHCGICGVLPKFNEIGEIKK